MSKQLPAFLIILSLSIFILTTSLSAQCPALPDIDSDGIGNSCDLDLDNDGILNSDEAIMACAFTTDMEYSIYTDDFDEGAYSDGDPIVRTFYVGLYTYDLFTPADVDSVKIIFGLPYVGVVDSAMMTLPDLTLSYTFIAGVFDSSDPDYSTQFCDGKTVEILGGTVYFLNGMFEVPINPYSMSFCAGGDEWSGITPASYYDCDNDDIPNEFDTDSDNDGCADALESAGNIEWNAVVNGMVVGDVDANGVPLLAMGGFATTPAVTDSLIADCNNTLAYNDFNNTPFQTPVTSNVLTNDQDNEGHQQTVTLKTPVPTGDGTVTLNTDGTYVFFPATGFVGETTFEYKACDDGTPQECKTAIVYIEVLPEVDPSNTSVIANPDYNTTVAGVTITSSLFTNDYDPEASNYTVTGLLMDADGDGNLNDPMSVGATTSPYGTDVTGAIIPAGTLIIDVNGDYTFTPAVGFEGQVMADYSITDGNSDHDQTRLFIDVIQASDNNTFASDDGNYTDVNVPVNANLLTNDNDPETHPTTITSILYDTDGDGLTNDLIPVGSTAPIYGYGNTGALIDAGMLTIQANGSYNYVPADDFIGNIVAIYTVCDDQSPMACDDATLDITVAGSFRDYGDAPSEAYSDAWTSAMTDHDGDNVPDAPTAVWLGTKVGFEASTKTNAAKDASADSFDDAMTFGTGPGQFPTNIQPASTYDIKVTLNGNQSGDTVYLGMWIDWDNDGTYDNFYNQSGVTNSPVDVTVSITTPASFVSGTPVNVRLRSDDEPLETNDFSGGLTNGEVEDYVIDVILPLELASFLGTSKGCYNILNWTTAIEVTTDYFEILYSLDGQQFSVLDALPAAGTSTTLKQYDFTQPTVHPRTYYQLRTVDIDGSVSLSDVVVINSACAFLNAFTLYPNPANKVINLSFTADLDRVLDLTLTDALGRVVINKQLEVSTGLNTFELITDQLAAGIYYLGIPETEFVPQKVIIINE